MNPLKTYLSEAGESQEDFAARVMTTVATISRLCSDKLRPGLDLAHRIERCTEGLVPTEYWERQIPAQDDAADARVAA